MWVEWNKLKMKSISIRGETKQIKNFMGQAQPIPLPLYSAPIVIPLEWRE